MFRKIAAIVCLIFLSLVTAQTAIAAVAYDGTGDSHVITDPNVGSTGPITVCLWFKTSAFNDSQTVAYYGNGTDSAAGRGFVVEEINIDATTGKLRALMFNGATSTDIVSPTLTINTFYHICFVLQETPDSLIYLDATDGLSDVSNDTDAWTIQNSTDDFVSGGVLPSRTGAGATEANSTVVFLSYWNTALTGPQIASMADKTTCPTAVASSNLKVFMKLLTIGSGTESSTNAFSYTETGNPTTVSDPAGLPCSTSGGVLGLNDVCGLGGLPGQGNPTGGAQ